LEPEGSSPYSQVPATSPYPEPTPSSPHNPLPLPLNILIFTVELSRDSEVENGTAMSKVVGCE